MKKRKSIGLILGMVAVTIISSKNTYALNYKTSILQHVESKKENTINLVERKEGEVIITYEKQSPATTFIVMASSMVNNYSIEGTVDFENVKAKNNNVKSYTIASKSEKSTTLSMSLVKSDKYSTEELIKILKEKDWVISAEPNYIVKTNSLTNDTYIDYQWALENKGQNGGTEGLDINPIKTNGENEKVIAIVDSGVDYTHPDLINAMWQNPYNKEELPGTYGYDFVNDDNDPMDDMMHGTHCAGIIAAEPNNKEGITGAIMGAGNIKIMALKILDGEGYGTEYGDIQAYSYIYKAQQLGTNIVAVNNSWGGYVPVDNEGGMDYCNSLLEAINLVGQNGAISVCAAGNEGYELDEKGQTMVQEKNANGIVVNEYKAQEIPAGLNSEYIISVAATNEKDEIATFSNYGKVDIAAPGTAILSTVPCDNINFNPTIFSENETNSSCQIYYNFENGINGIDYNTGALSNTEGRIYKTNKISNSDNKFFGVNGKSLKWEFDYTSYELEQGIMPYLELKNFNVNGNKNYLYYLYLSYLCSKSSEMYVIWSNAAWGVASSNYWKNINAKVYGTPTGENINIWDYWNEGYRR